LTAVLDQGRVEVRFSNRAHGDLNADAVEPGVVAARWRAIADRPVAWLDEVHGTDVVVIDTAAEAVGRTGDALVTARPGVALGIWVGDCAPVTLVAPEGIVGAAHAGWRGLVAGVLHQTVLAMRALGATHIDGFLGPCIHVECNEFGRADLDCLIALFGPAVEGATAWGTPALDLPAAVGAALALDGVPLAPMPQPCTACDERFWSRRARSDRARQGMAVWREAA
jgi:copper oxidase (laccase) domain-containing protein